MFEPWFHEIARQRQQDLLASGERYRLGRIVRGRTADRETAASKRAFAVRIRRTSKLAAQSEV